MIADRSDAQLIADHLAGDRKALPTLLLRYRQLIERFCIRYRADIDDVMQECAVRALPWLVEFDQVAGSFSRWITKVARSVAAGYARWIRDVARAVKFPLLTQSEDLERPDWRMERAQLRWLVSTRVDKLQPMRREYVRLRYWEDEDMQTIAQELGRKNQTVCNQLTIALDSLYQDMGFEGVRPVTVPGKNGHRVKKGGARPRRKKAA